MEGRKEGGVTSCRTYRSPDFIVQSLYRYLHVRVFSPKCKVKLDG